MGPNVNEIIFDRFYFFKIDVWTEMAKEMKQNFGPHRSKSVTKPDSAMGSGGSSWGMSAIPPLTSTGHSVAIQQQTTMHSAANAQDRNSIGMAIQLNLDIVDLSISDKLFTISRIPLFQIILSIKNCNLLISKEG